MEITISSFFWLSVTSIIIMVVLELRKHKILRDLAGNLVTIQIKNEDTSTKLIALHARMGGTLSDVWEYIKRADVDRKLLDDTHDNVQDLKKQLQEMSDRLQQHRIVVSEQIRDLESKLTSQTASEGSIMDQIQKIGDIRHLIDLAKKSGEAIDKVGPVIDLLGKVVGKESNGTKANS